MGKTKKVSLTNDLLDELLEDSTAHPHSHEEDSSIDLDPGFEFGDMTHPVDEEDKTAKVEMADEGTVPILHDVSSSGKSKKSSDSQPRSRAAVGRAEPLRSPSGMLGPTEAALAQSENLRLAQDRILDLEKEIERLRVRMKSSAPPGKPSSASPMSFCPATKSCAGRWSTKFPL